MPPCPHLTWEVALLAGAYVGAQQPAVGRVRCNLLLVEEVGRHVDHIIDLHARLTGAGTPIPLACHVHIHHVTGALHDGSGGTTGVAVVMTVVVAVPVMARCEKATNSAQHLSRQSEEAVQLCGKHLAALHAVCASPTRCTDAAVWAYSLTPLSTGTHGLITVREQHCHTSPTHTEALATPDSMPQWWSLVCSSKHNTMQHNTTQHTDKATPGSLSRLECWVPMAVLLLHNLKWNEELILCKWVQCFAILQGITLLA